jgi:hypothetical protein
MRYRRNLVVSVTIASVVMWTYFGTLGIRGDERFDDLELHGDDMYFWEVILLGVGLLGSVGMFFVGLVHSFKNGHRGWSALILIFWPLAFIYPWLHAQELIGRAKDQPHRPNKGFNRTPVSSGPAKPGEPGGGAG